MFVRKDDIVCAEFLPSLWTIFILYQVIHSVFGTPSLCLTTILEEVNPWGLNFQSMRCKVCLSGEIGNGVCAFNNLSSL